jgi:hypothetical protein
MEPIVLYAWGPHRTMFDTRVLLLDDASVLPGLKPKPGRFRELAPREVSPGQPLMALSARLLTSTEVNRVEKHGFVFQRMGDILQSEVPWSKVGQIVTAVMGNQVDPIRGIKRPRAR